MKKCRVFGENQRCSCGEQCVEVTAERETGRWWDGWLRLNSVCHVEPDTPLRQGVPGAGVAKDQLGGGRVISVTKLCFCSVAQLCLTLCDPMDCSTPGFPVHHQLPELAQTQVHQVSDTIQPSHPVVPFSSCLQSFPASGSFLRSQFFTSGGQSIGASASASVLPMNIQG